MKKIISILSAAAIISSLICPIGSAASAALPENGMIFRVEAKSGITQNNRRQISKWEDLSQSGHDLIGPSNKNSQPTFIASDNGIKESGVVHFTQNRYLTSESLDYEGSASLILYYKQLDNNSGNTLFSSHSYIGSSDVPSGKTPFTIENSNNQKLAFKMADADGEKEYDMNVSALGNQNDKYAALIVTIDAGEKKVNVYSSESEDISVPAASFEISEAPYWEALAYSVKYNAAAANKGMTFNLAESALYNRVLSADEIKAVSQHFAVNYSEPVIGSIKLKNEIKTIARNKSVLLEIVGIGTLPGETGSIETTINDAEVTSSDSNVVMVLRDSEGRPNLKAVNFGTAKITIKYKDVEEINFIVEVPQVIVEEAVIGDFSPDTDVSCSRKVENFAPAKPLSLIMAAALYKKDMLIEAEFETKENITESYTFETSFHLPQDITDCNIHFMLLNAETMAPISECTIKY